MNTENSAIFTWGLILRVLVKAGLFFMLCNLVYALVTPLETLGGLSLYNRVVPGRERLPYGEIPSEDYNLSLFNIPAMFAAHSLSRGKADDEFRVLLLGDSGTWGWFLEADDTLAARINAGEHSLADGRRVVAYNVGYPVMSLTKDLLLLDHALDYEPDMVVWLTTLRSFPRDKQLFAPIVQHNADRVRRLIERHDLQIEGDDARFVQESFLARTIVGQRRALADLLRLQIYGFSWAATGIDQFIPAEITPRRADFDTNLAWESFGEPQDYPADALAFDVLGAGVALAGDVPLLLVNEPIFISDGANSDLHYNSWYPRWAYDRYRALFAEQAENKDWVYLDLWNSIAPENFSDSPVHLTPEGSAQFSEIISEAIIDSRDGQNSDG